MIDKFKKGDGTTEIHTHHHHESSNFLLYVIITGLMALPVFANEKEKEKYKAEKGEDYKEWKFETRSIFAGLATGWFIEPIAIGAIIYDYVITDGQKNQIDEDAKQ